MMTKKSLETELNREKALNKVYEDNNRQLREMIEKMECCQNCKHCSEIISYKVLGGKEISKICSDGHYVCDKWEIKEK